MTTKLTVVGHCKLPNGSARITMEGQSHETSHLFPSFYFYVPWADRSKFEIGTEFTMELWENVPERIEGVTGL